MKKTYLLLGGAVPLLVLGTAQGLPLAGPSAAVSAADCLPEYPGLPVVAGDDTPNTLDGTSAPERMCGFGGADTLRGLDGDDVLSGGDGDDLLYGNAGNDRVLGNAGRDTVYGGQNNDTLNGGRDDDTLHGDLGDDLLWGDLGRDTVRGGQGNDRYGLRVGDEGDTLGDEGGGDSLWLPDRTNPRSVLYLREGNHLRLRDAQSGLDLALIENHYGTGALESFEFGNADLPANSSPYGSVDLVTPTTVNGWAFDPNLATGSLTVHLHVKRPDGALVAVLPATANLSRPDVVAAGAAPHELIGFSVSVPAQGDGDYVYELYALDAQGDSTKNALLPHGFGAVRFATGSTDTTRPECMGQASAGPDYLRGLEGNDLLSGLGGADVLSGNKGQDKVEGGQGADTLYGGDGADVLRGGGDHDTLYGDLGDDWLHGESGNDWLYGGEGADRFVYRRGDGSDVVADATASDRILLTRLKPTEVSYLDSGLDRTVQVAGGGSLRILNYHLNPPAITFDTRPNIILILADDLGYGEIAPYGQARIKTPHLAALASEGLRFTDFYSSSAVCPPARNALLTGNHTGHTAVRWFNGEVLRPALDSLPQVLGAAGYRTAMFGKWGVGDVGTESPPHLLGWDHFVGMLTHVDAHAHYLDGETKKCTTSPIDSHLWARSACSTVPYPIAPTRYVNDEFTDQALSFIDAHKSEPFLLYLPYTLPHAELAVPNDSLLQQYLVSPTADPTLPQSSLFNLPNDPEVPYAGGGGYCRAQPIPRATFAAMVSRLDWYVGRLVDRLKQAGLDGETVILFTADNGPHSAGGKRPVDLTFFNSTGGLKGDKATLFEGGLRVPMLVRWPGRVAAGRVTNVMAAGYDLLPTLAELAGTAAPSGIDGRSLVPVLNGSSAPVHDFLYFEGDGRGLLGATTAPDYYGTRQAVRYGQWKGLRRWNGSSDSDPNSYLLQLYDLSANGGAELQDVAGNPANAAVLQTLKSLMNTERTTSNILPGYPTIPPVP